MEDSRVRQRQSGRRERGEEKSQSMDAALARRHDTLRLNRRTFTLQVRWFIFFRFGRCAQAGRTGRRQRFGWLMGLGGHR